MSLPEFNDLIEMANEAVSMRRIYDFFHLDYRRSDGNTQCRCPFHGEDIHPSARIYEETNSWFCFTCGFSKTPLFFYMKMYGRPLTDTVYNFFIDFRREIIQAYPDLMNETFSEDDIRRCYNQHLLQGPSGLVSQNRFMNVHMQSSDSGLVTLPEALLGDSPSKFYTATRNLWQTFYTSPNFRPLYIEFSKLLDRLKNQEDSSAPIELNLFLSTLQAKLSSVKSI